MRVTKLLAAGLGFLMIIGSFALAVAGGVALAVPDDDGWISAGPVRLSTEAVGFVGEDIELDLGEHIRNRRTFVGWDAIPARFEVDSRNDKDIFIGVASAAEARSYLAGVAMDRIEDFHHDPELVQVTGAYSIAPPTEQTFWVASSTDGNLSWDVGDGEWAIVVLNADGSSGVDVSVTGSARIPFLGVIGVVLIAVGLVGMSVGGFLTYYGVRRVRDQRSESPQPPSAQPLAT